MHCNWIIIKKEKKIDVIFTLPAAFQQEVWCAQHAYDRWGNLVCTTPEGMTKQMAKHAVALDMKTRKGYVQQNLKNNK